MAINRPKQPEILRARILHAAQTVLLEEGIAALTQEKVLIKLDISKGGLQHHFRTKQQLLDALFQHLFEGFVAQYREQLAQEKPGPAKHTRAYVLVSLRHGAATVAAGRALTLLALSNAKYQTDWAGYLEEMCAADALDRGVQLACRLFADGLWYAYVLGPAPDTATAQSAAQKILQLAEQGRP